jgi:hypothetical protein
MKKLLNKLPTMSKKALFNLFFGLPDYICHNDGRQWFLSQILALLRKKLATLI